MYQPTNCSKKKNCSRKNLFNHQFHQSKNLLLTEKSIVHQQSRKTGFWKKGINENSSSSLHTQWAIDQGATRLGGYRIRVHAKRWGLPFFSRLYSMLNHGRNSESFKFIYLSWRKLPGLKRVWIQQVEDFGCLDVNLRVWNASEFNKSKILFEECSRCSLLHIQKICVKDIWNVCTFH